MRGKPREGKAGCGGTRFLKEGAPLTATMHNRASCWIEGSRPQDACWLHAEWTRIPSGKSRGECGIILGRLSGLPQKLDAEIF